MESESTIIRIGYLIYKEETVHYLDPSEDAQLFKGEGAPEW